MIENRKKDILFNPFDEVKCVLRITFFSIHVSMITNLYLDVKQGIFERS